MLLSEAKLGKTRQWAGDESCKVGWLRVGIVEKVAAGSPSGPRGCHEPAPS